MAMLDYYCQQSPITDPGEFAWICDDLPDDIARATLDEARADEWARLFADDRLRLPPVIQSYSPAAKPEEMPLDVVLDFAAGQ